MPAEPHAVGAGVDAAAGTAAGTVPAATAHTGADAEGRDCVVLDAGERPIATLHFARVVRAIGRQQIVAAEQGRNSNCFRVTLGAEGGVDGAADAMAVKAPRPGAQRTNADTTFAAEASVLARLPGAGVDNAPRLLARVAAEGTHFLFTTWVEGAHPDPLTQPLGERRLAWILARCTTMDCAGLLHYDLKADNLLVDGDAVAFVDFEFARFDGLFDAFAPARVAYCDDFNVSGNPHFPARSNVANFEFRTLVRYCETLAAARAPDAGRAFFRSYLRQRAYHHARMAAFFGGLEGDAVAAMAAQGGIGADAVRRRLARAAAHERMTARLLRHALPRIASLEWALAVLRHDVFERSGKRALARARRLVAALQGGSGAAGALPAAYTDAAAATVESIARSHA
jgi:predicted Ser/Thr protein kinase